ncbi:MAG: cytochrome c3 family protein [Candidatus Eisenbacteria bacterium]
MKRTLAAFLFAALLLPAFAPAARAQVSPGPLAAPHAALDGSLECLKCHGKAGGRGDSKTGMDERCLACHTEIGWMRTARRGTHARDMAKNCASCHPDHGGRDFALVVWPEGSAQKFDHRRAGYVLEGKHATLACEKCHTARLQKSGAAPLIRRKNRNASWLGLETACASCHDDVHRGQLGKKCESCHGQEKFTPAPGFDHAKSAFPLTGAHAKVECLKCHAAPQFVKARDAKGQPLPQWKPLPHKDCVSCHKDPHAGRFPGACAKCHTTEGWKNVSRSGFNHDVTRYPLRGRHAQVACEKCHDVRQGGFGQKPKFAACTDCHKDAHAGTATLAGVAADCAACHSVAGWTPSTYTVAQHAKSTYPLEGRHATTACVKCHVRAATGTSAAAALGPARVQLRPKKAACADCHHDPHRGRFEPTGARAKKNGCRACHTLNTFRPSSYDAVAHADCVFPLRGGHLATPCQACHQELAAPPARSSLAADSASARVLAFDQPRRACVECHAAQSPHGDQFAHRRDKGACEGCHVDFTFVPASKFDHDRDSSYRLEGAHARTPCASCHVPKPDASGRTVVTYRPTPTKCEACHTSGAVAPLTPGGGR